MRYARCLTVLTLVAALVLATACTTSQDATPKTIRIGTFRATVCAALLILDQYLPEGYEVEITYFNSTADLKDAVMSKSVDFGAAGLTAPIAGRSVGEPLTIIANMAERGTAIIARSDSGIQTVADLRGKQVGYVPLSIHHILLLEELAKEGLDPETDLTLVRLGPADMPAALQRGDIDAFSGNEPNSTLTLMEGYGTLIVYPYDNPVGSINAGVFTHDDLIREQPELVETFVKAFAQATEHFRAAPEELTETVADAWGFDAGLTEASLVNLELVWDFDEAALHRLQEYTDRLLELGVIEQMPDFDSVIDLRFMEAARGA